MQGAARMWGRAVTEALQNEEGNWAFDQMALREMVLGYFREIYTSNPGAIGRFMRGAFHQLLNEKVRGLD